jgi:hypothetical protein
MLQESMKSVTRRIDAASVVLTALEFANRKDVSDARSMCKKLHVLPPGAAYHIDQKGRVFPTKVRVVDVSRLTRRVKERQIVLRDVFTEICEGREPMVVRQSRSRPMIKNRSIEIDDPNSYTGKSSLVIIVRKPPGPMVNLKWLWASWWRVQRTVNGEIVDEDAFVIPTLDGLVGAAAAILWEHRRHLRRCNYQHCWNFFYRSTKRKRLFCSTVCRDEAKRLKTKLRVRRARLKASRARSAKGNS